MQVRIGVESEDAVEDDDEAEVGGEIEDEIDVLLWKTVTPYSPEGPGHSILFKSLKDVSLGATVLQMFVCWFLGISCFFCGLFLLRCSRLGV